MSSTVNDSSRETAISGAPTAVASTAQESGTGVVDGLGRAEKQPHPDGAADRDELDVPFAQVTREIQIALRH